MLPPGSEPFSGLLPVPRVLDELSLPLSASLRWITLAIQVSILIYEIPLYHDVTLFTNIREKRHLGII